MAIVYLDSGHAKVTKGKRSPDSTLMEWEFNKHMTNLIDVELRRCGIQTVIINPTPESGDDMPLSTRCNKANSHWSKAGKPSALFISNHANAAGDSWHSASGTETFISKGSSNKSLEAAKLVQNSIVSTMGTRDRGVKREDFTVIVKTSMPAILIEYGFYSNKDECAMLKDHNKRKQMAVAVAKSVCKHFGVTYKPSSGEQTSAPSSSNTEFKVGDLNKTVTVNTDVLNVRSGRGAEFNKIGQLKQGDKVEIWTIDKAKDGSLWGSFRYNPQNIGYIHMGFVKL